ncbi:MAG: efflux transporter outer membrane subunit [Acidobacteriota bacterium]|nr:efflux transporter outer membrane subunit [Acidobacteriota bacterium]
MKRALAGLPGLLLALLLAGCAVGPNYSRPAVAAPPQFRGASESAEAKSLADTKWFDLFHDDTLKQLVDTALKQNFDLQIAAERVLEARAQLGVIQAARLPNIDATGGFDLNRGSRIGANRFVPAGVSLDSSYTQAGFSLGWELEIAQQNRKVGEDNLRLTTLRKNRGAATGLDVHQAEQLLYTATAEIAALEREIAQTENALSLLLGQNPGDMPRGKTLEELTAPPEVPAGLPSGLLERRPDIRQAEQELMAANAQIGVAKAQYFPQITLTGFMGGQSRALENLFTGPGRLWNAATPAFDLPVFNAGRVRANVRLTEAQQREALATYRKTIETAFREVSDSLVGYRKIGEQRAQEELLLKALRETSRLSTLRYQGGLDSYLQVLDAERNRFQGELALAQLREQEVLSVVQLYRALGGGWQ